MSTLNSGGGEEDGVFLYVAYKGMWCCLGHGFQAFWSGTGCINL